MKRNQVLGASLMATLAAAGWFALQDDASDEVELAAGPRRVSVAERSDSSRRAPTSAAPAATAWPEPPAARSSEPWPFDAVRARAWLPAAPPVMAAVTPSIPTPAAVAAAAPAPQAPTFPYAWIGRIEEGGRATALLSGPLQTLGVKPFDVIDGQWRVDEIHAQSLTVTWLPGGQRQTLALRAS